ncbi:extracellular solute-binding protein [Noviherbaspirillum aerium]|uniref:extracellular solute-binding protein n=1 Tax=Noviherbaspirillum aerium TaxID=2588497 RepID=UPI001CEF687D|nr:extracellular solute-binding protein [Noviherbaspirillum aerium]
MRLIKMLAILMLAAAGNAPAFAQTEVRLWTLLGGGDGARMRSMIKDFNASQREVKVVETVLKWGEPFYTKLITASVVGAGPDLATIHLSRIGNLAGGGVLRPISDEELKGAGLKQEDFYPRQWSGAQYRNQTYAVPLDLHMLVLYYNKTLARRARLLDEEGRLRPIEDIGALTQAFRAVRQHTGEHGMTMESGPNSFAVWRLWLSMLAQRNATLINGSGFAYGKAGEESLAVISDWFAQGYASRGLDYPASTSQFTSGKAGFMINGVWEVPELVAARKAGILGFDFGIVPFPRLYGNRSVWGDSHGFAIPANAGRPLSGEKVRAVLSFVAYVSRHSLEWAQGGHVPAYRPVAESAAARALMPNAMYAGSVEHVIDEAAGWYAGAAGPLQSIASKYLPAALSGQLTAPQALHRFETESARLLRKPPPQY